MNGTLIAFDFGTKSIGVAIGQYIIGTAWPLTTIKSQNGKPEWSMIKKLLNEWHPNEVVVGLPLNMDSTEQILTTRARKFAYNIRSRFNIMVKFQDERLSTVEARVRLFEHGGFRALNKNSVDATSAAIILESFLNET